MTTLREAAKALVEHAETGRVWSGHPAVEAVKRALAAPVPSESEARKQLRHTSAPVRFAWERSDDYDHQEVAELLDAVEDVLAAEPDPPRIPESEARAALRKALAAYRTKTTPTAPSMPIEVGVLWRAAEALLTSEPDPPRIPESEARAALRKALPKACMALQAALIAGQLRLSIPAREGDHDTAIKDALDAAQALLASEPEPTDDGRLRELRASVHDWWMANHADPYLPPARMLAEIDELLARGPKTEKNTSDPVRVAEHKSSQPDLGEGPTMPNRECDSPDGGHHAAKPLTRAELARACRKTASIFSNRSDTAGFTTQTAFQWLADALEKEAT